MRIRGAHTESIPALSYSYVLPVMSQYDASRCMMHRTITSAQIGCRSMSVVIESVELVVESVLLVTVSVA